MSTFPLFWSVTAEAGPREQGVAGHHAHAHWGNGPQPGPTGLEPILR